MSFIFPIDLWYQLSLPEKRKGTNKKMNDIDISLYFASIKQGFFVHMNRTENVWKTKPKKSREKSENLQNN